MERTIGLSSLPEKARGELMDFYEFLRWKYGHRKKLENEQTK